MILIVNEMLPNDAVFYLQKMGHIVIPSMTVSTLSPAIAKHPDIQIHPLEEHIAITAPECYDYYREKLPPEIKLQKGQKSLGDTYPEDCAYNVAKVDKLVFCNTKVTDPTILTYYQKNNRKIIHVNQGYTKCNMAILGNDCVITEDIGIHNSIIANNLPLSVYLVPKSEIALSDFPYGFIGGASGGDKGTLFWYGDMTYLSYQDVLKRETAKRNITNIALLKGNMQDLGGIICFP